MKYYKLDPPGTWCLHEAFFDILKTVKGKRFVEFGCGDASLSWKLFRRGYDGIGIDFSAKAIQKASHLMDEAIRRGRYRLLQANILEMPLPREDDKGNIVFSMMVIEHVENEKLFLTRMADWAAAGGWVILGVPARSDKWGVEDETAGHFRRYDKSDLQSLLIECGLRDVQVWSAGIPISNMLYWLSNLIIQRSAESAKKELCQDAKTKLSGIREIPYKTVFPSWAGLLLNRVALFPFFILQRWFYRSGKGLMMIGFGRVS